MIKAILRVLTVHICIVAGSVSAYAKSGEHYTMENAYLRRTLVLEKNQLRTKEIVNKRAGTTLDPLECNEFQLRISEGTHTTETDRILTTADFTCVNVSEYAPEGSLGKGIAFQLTNEVHALEVTVRYELLDDDFYLRKQLELKAGREIVLERIDVEAIAFKHAYQPYTIKEITSQSNRKMQPGWRPGLGQPLFTKESGTFWGVEFPAAYNYVADRQLLCGYQYGQILKPNMIYKSYKAVMGCSDDAHYNSQVFYDYINRIRIRPLRLQRQYNSWFDYGPGVSREKLIKSVNKVNDELCIKRGVTPIKAYVIDDGWQDSQADWSDRVWKVNNKFGKNFSSSHTAAKNAQSTLGLWLSPQCNFGAIKAVAHMREKKMGALSKWMSLANTPYMDLLEKRMVELTQQGISYFKLDGTFGHQFMRDFDVNGAAHGVPTMPQLNAKHLDTTDPQLNDSKYDELKIYYLTVGSERLMKIFAEMSRVNPDVYIVISNGAYLSPWWLMHCDAVWMINAGDAAGGSDRTGELVYRDGVYHEIWQQDHTHYPMNSLFNHEPKKKKSGESAETFRKYLYMNMSRGTGFVELYLRTFSLSQSDWDVLAEGLHWVEHVFPTFTRSCMHGGDPRRKEVYGFTAWNSEQGYISIHNPSETKQFYNLKINRDLGLLPSATVFYTSSPIDGSLNGLEETYKYGDTLSLALKPREIRIINFGVKEHEWTTIKALQNRTRAFTGHGIPRP